MILSDAELSECLIALELDPKDIDNITLKQASKAFQRLALLVHPDKAGEEYTAQFQRLFASYEKLRNHFKQTKDKTDKGNFFDDWYSFISFSRYSGLSANFLMICSSCSIL